MDADSDKTRLIRPKRKTPPPIPTPVETSGEVDLDETRILDRSPQATPVTDIPLGGDDTRILERGPDQAGGYGVGGEDDSSKTKLVRRSSKKHDPEVVASSSAGPGTFMDDPVTGWLVVIAGPGKGSMVSIGEQDNRVGRGGGADAPRVCLDFGDAGISRSNAFVLRYDPKKRRFKILPGEGSNIVYVNEDDLDSPMALMRGDVIEVSETKLRFVPFCGEDFDWMDTEHADS